MASQDSDAFAVRSYVYITVAADAAIIKFVAEGERSNEALLVRRGFFYRHIDDICHLRYVDWRAHTRLLLEVVFRATIDELGIFMLSPEWSRVMTP